MSRRWPTLSNSLFLFLFFSFLSQNLGAGNEKSSSHCTDDSISLSVVYCSLPCCGSSFVRLSPALPSSRQLILNCGRNSKKRRNGKKRKKENDAMTIEFQDSTTTKELHSVVSVWCLHQGFSFSCCFFVCRCRSFILPSKQSE